ncbi:MAG: TolC family protein [Bacteroidales bacterium]|nr:TolC family protein [Bacteroidales bacterium]
MIKNLIILIALLITIPVAEAQQSPPRILAMDQLIDSAMMHFPISEKKALIQQSRDMKVENIRSTYLPSALLNGQASYQSDVTKINVPIPGFSAPQIAKDWYKLNLDISQMIYDGGYTRVMSEVEQKDMRMQTTEVEQAEQEWRDKVAKLYFRALTFGEQMKVIRLLMNNLDLTVTQLASSLKSGVVLQSDVDAVKAEKLNYQQQQAELSAGYTATLSMLSVFCGFSITGEDSLLVPEFAGYESVYANHRKEDEYFVLATDKLSSIRKLETVNRRPKISAFGQYGYGRPGYNMLDDGFSDYYMVGLRLNYKIWDWKNAQRNRQLIDIQQSMLALGREQYQQQHKASWEAQVAEIDKFDLLIQYDNQILSLQKSVIETAYSRMKNGMITTTAYLIELNKHAKSLLDLETHKIRQINARYDLKYITGNHE